MADTNCRIGRIKMKSGGEIHNLPSKQYEGHRATIIRHAREIADLNHDMDGFFIIAWDKQGGYSVGWRYDNQGCVPQRLFPSWIAEVARDEIITEDTAASVVNRMIDCD